MNTPFVFECPEKQADMYRMYAYVTKLRAKAGVLLYPDIDEREYGTCFFECVGPAGEERTIPLLY